MLTVVIGMTPIIMLETTVPVVVEPNTQTITTTLPRLAALLVLRPHVLGFDCLFLFDGY
jgi:hypothetical protein